MKEGTPSKMPDSANRQGSIGRRSLRLSGGSNMNMGMNMFQRSGSGSGSGSFRKSRVSNGIPLC